MPEPVVGDLLSETASGRCLWLLHYAVVTVVLRRGSGVMWCGSRERGGDRLLKIALDPAFEARRYIFLRKEGFFTQCTRTAGPLQHGKDGWSSKTLCACTTRAPRVYSAAWQRVSRAGGGAPAPSCSGHSCKQSAAVGAG
jgi:hypothetical protein